jgi:DNA-binding NarL/FixJ family response regulator
MRLPPVLATILSGRLDSGRMAMKRALLVEDHAAFREALAKVLEWEAGFEKVPQAGSLSEGLARAGVLDGDLDVAVVNLGLPDGDGTDLISQMRSTEPYVPVLVLTLSRDPARHAQALDAGAERVLTKDASVEEIVDAVRRLGTGDPAVASS